MKKILIRYIIPALCLVFSGATIGKSIRSDYKAIRADYLLHANGKTRHFITSIIQ